MKTRIRKPDVMKCWFCETTGSENGVCLETTGIKHPEAGVLICPSCKKEAIAFWKHHFDLGLLQ